MHIDFKLFSSNDICKYSVLISRSFWGQQCWSCVLFSWDSCSPSLEEYLWLLEAEMMLGAFWEVVVCSQKGTAFLKTITVSLVHSTTFYPELQPCRVSGTKGVLNSPGASVPLLAVSSAGARTSVLEATLDEGQGGVQNWELQGSLHPNTPRNQLE